MAAEQLVEQILSKHPGMLRERIKERLTRERKKTNGLISDEILLRMIAGEFGVQFDVSRASAPELPVANLVPGLNDVSVVGRVVAVYKPKTFTGRKNGMFASFFIVDRSSILRVVLWNSKASLLESDGVKVGEIVRVSHGYTKEGREGVELHVGEKSKIETSPSDMKESDFPSVSSFMMRIGDVVQKRKNRRVNVAGVVGRIFKTSTFERQDSTTGKVMRLILRDESEEVSVVAWNEKAEELEGMLKEGAGLRLIGAKAKMAESGALELHVDSGTYAEVFQDGEAIQKVISLKEGSAHVSVEGTIVAAPTLREVKTAKQEIVNLTTFQIADETGCVWVSAWRQHALNAVNLKAGDKISLKNAYAKKGFNGQLEVSTRDGTYMAVVNQ